MSNVIPLSSRLRSSVPDRLQAVREILVPLGFSIFEADGSTADEPRFEIWSKLKCGIDVKLANPGIESCGVTLAELEELPWAVADALDDLAEEGEQSDPLSS